MKKDRKNEISGVLFLLLGLFALASLFFFHPEDIPYYTSHPASPVQNYTGVIGAYLAFGLFWTFGTSAFVIPVIFLVWSWCYFLQKVPEKKLFKFFGLITALFSTSTLITISVDPSMQLEKGGVIGYLIGTQLLRYFGYLGSFILATSCLLLSLLLATDFLLYPIVKAFMKRFGSTFETIQEYAGEFYETILEKIDDFRESREETKEKTQKTTKKKAAAAAPSKKQPLQKTLPEMPLKVKRYRQEFEEDKKSAAKADKEKLEKEIKETVVPPKPAPPAKPKPQVKYEPSQASKEGEEKETDISDVIGSGSADQETYQLPPMDLLKRPDKMPASNNDNLQENSKILESTLAEFGIEVKVVEIEQGPVITRYELLPAPGVKVNSISALSDDIALALKARSIRLIVPIPGKSAVGVEVPNSVTSTVFVREIINDDAFKSDKHTLPLALGKNTSGKTMVSDLSTMPHMLVAGTTGSGKTVSVNAIILGLLYTCKPSELKFIMIDPKMVELAVYNKIPHMLSPVVTDVKKAAHTLNWVVNEMERRYKLLATVGVRNIQSFNERELDPEDEEQVGEKAESENVIPAKLPYIVVVVDELADLMMVAQDKVETAIARLAQLSRAVGIHLILATQRPSVDVITGVIKANFPARVAFKVASKVDSRTILDAMGADKLLGRGDMLFMRPGDEKPIRGQAPLVIDAEINAVVKHVAGQAEPEYHEEIQNAQKGKTGGGATEKDELFDEAVAVVLETGQASTSNLQRRLRLGYTRAARIIDQMEAEGLIGPSQGAKPREIYISNAPAEAEEEFEEEVEKDEGFEEVDEEETVEME